MKNSRIIFVTGTDTGVGKTLLTALLTFHLRKTGVHALAMKPFCSGGLADVKLLRAAQAGELSEEEVNPFYFSKPLSPLVAAGNKQLPSLKMVVGKIHSLSRRCKVLLIEGSGGLMVPLGKNYFVADLIENLRSEVVIVARNKLGTINHTLLSVREIERRGVNRKITTVMMAEVKPDLSAAMNPTVVQEILSPRPVFLIPFLGRNANKTSNLEKNYTKIKKTLAQLV
jgi:dethiobiotin synthetase